MYNDLICICIDSSHSSPRPDNVYWVSQLPSSLDELAPQIDPPRANGIIKLFLTDSQLSRQPEPSIRLTWRASSSFFTPEQAIRIIWSINASLIAGVMVPVAGEDLGFLQVLLADDGFLLKLLVEDGESVLTVFRFCLGGMNGSKEEWGDGELVSVLTGMLRGN